MTELNPCVICRTGVGTHDGPSDCIISLSKALEFANRNFIDVERQLHESRGELRASERQGGDAIEGGELVRLLTEVMREADRKFEKVGGSTRHHVRDCLIPELETAGLAVVRAGSRGATGWVDCDVRLPEPGVTVLVLLRSRVYPNRIQSEPVAARLDDDGDWMGADSHELRLVKFWTPIPSLPAAPVAELKGGEG